MPNISRRNFLVGCSSAIAAMAGARLNSVVFGAPEDEGNEEILVSVFLRGGADVLNLLPPIGGTDRSYYESLRSDLIIPSNNILRLGTHAFGLHPAMSALHEVYEDGNLAIVQATGMHVNTRSHFDSMSYMDLGTPGDKSTSNGWITRHLQSSATLPDEILAPALAVGHSAGTAFRGSNEVMSIHDPSHFSLNTSHWQWLSAQRVAMRKLYTSQNSFLHSKGEQTLNATDLMEANNLGPYIPPAGVNYPDNQFGRHLSTVAQMVRLELGLRVATVDLGGWDTHEYQGNSGTGYFADLVRTLSDGLAALYADLVVGNYNKRVTIVVMSEFGRKVNENSDHGTDHGHGGAMLILGGNVIGGLHGQWPGLAPAQLYDGTDIAVTTDYRRVLSEILIRRLQNPELGQIFPAYRNYAPLGIVKGTDIAPVYGDDDGGGELEEPPVKVAQRQKIFLPVLQR